MMFMNHGKECEELMAEMLRLCQKGRRWFILDIELTRGYGKAWTESITTVLPEIMMLLRQDVAKWFAYTINFGVKHVIDHQ